jgi:PAS domain S-box-containing protein
MEAQSESSTEEIKHLRRCINDLLSILTLPATWTGGTAPRIVGNLLDALVRMLSLDFVYAHLRDPTGGSPAEMVRIRPAWEGNPQPEEIGKRLRAWLENHPDKVSPPVRISFDERDIALVLLQLGLHGDMGVIVAGSERLDFPQQTERLVLHVAANQAAIGLQESRLLSEERRNSSDLKQRVAQRTMELATINDELNKAHAQIIQSEERWRSVFENSAIGVALTDLNGRFIAANPVYQKMLGYTEEELRQLSFLDITVEEDRNLNWALIEELLEGKRRQFQIEKQYRRKNGSTVWVRNSVSVVPGTERVPRFIMALSEDVTEQHEAKAALDKARSDLAQVARISTLNALTASIAHELNQPLSGVITNASTCTRMLAADPPNVEGARETARRTIRDGNRASEVVTRLRALFTKKETATESVDLNDATREVIALSSGELERNRVIVRTDLAGDLPLVTGDRVQLQQVILNLLRNASDAMSTIDDRPRELVIKTERSESDGVRLSVKDTGVGIDPQIEAKLFEAFHSTKDDGMGIGLFVSRSIMERHQGRLWAIRNQGLGATFILAIPSSTNT